MSITVHCLEQNIVVKATEWRPFTIFATEYGHSICHVSGPHHVTAHLKHKLFITILYIPCVMFIFILFSVKPKLNALPFISQVTLFY